MPALGFRVLAVAFCKEFVRFMVAPSRKLPHSRLPRGGCATLSGAYVALVEPLLELARVDADRGSRSGADLDGRQGAGGDSRTVRSL